MRTSLIHGTRAAIRVAERKFHPADSWRAGVIGRRNKTVAVVSLTNKNARIVWALLAHDRQYAADYAPLA